jgi:ribosomal protein S18 acetylase RimI-like enzyme
MASPARRVVDEVLDNPVWHALIGPQREFAITSGAASWYREDVAPFGAVADDADPAAWHDLARLVGTSAVVVPRPLPDAPVGWTLDIGIAGFQMVERFVSRDDRGDDPEIVSLSRADAPAMIELVTLTEPGPFRPLTVDLGGYVGIRDRGRLIAMAGHRMQPPGWVEISAVCTHPDYRGRGLARRLLDVIVSRIHDAGSSAFLHVAGSNTGAANLYRSMGFVERRDIHFLVMHADQRSVSGVA